MTPKEQRQIIDDYIAGVQLEFRHKELIQWETVSKDHQFEFSECEYRRKPAPEIAKKRLVKVEELPFPCWVSDNNITRLIGGYSTFDKAIALFGEGFLPIDLLHKQGRRYSSDRHAPWDQWKPFEVEVATTPEVKEELHNPQNVPIEKLPKGTRFLNKSENVVHGNSNSIFMWSDIFDEWWSNYSGSDSSSTYCTTLTVQELKELEVA